MRARAALFACVLFVLASPVLHAQTLDELIGPMLPAGKVDLGVGARAYGVEHGSTDLFEGTTTWFEPQVVLFPSVAIGLSQKVQLRVDVTSQLPVTNVRPFYAGASVRETQTTRAASMGVTYRPSPGVQLEAGMLWGRGRVEATYPRTSEAQATDGATDTARAFRFGCAWLPRADRDNRPLRSDLDGLHRPVLGPNRWRIDGEFEWRMQGYVFHETVEGAAEHFDQRMDAGLARLRGGVAYGVAKGAQLAADLYWHPAFSAANATSGLSTIGGVPFSSSRAYSDRYHDVFGVRMSGTWRRDRFEATTTASREQQQVGPDWFRTSTVRMAGTWIWRKPRTTVERAGLAGFDRPLLEKGQAALDALVIFRSHTENVSQFNSDLRAWKAGIALGLLPSVEISAHAGTVYSKHFLSGRGYWRNPASGAGLTLRLTPRVQLVATAEFYSLGPLGTYPLFVLGVNDPFTSYRTFSDSDLSGGRNAQAGMRVIW